MTNTKTDGIEFMTLHYKNLEILFSKENMEATSSILVLLPSYAISCLTSESVEHAS